MHESSCASSCLSRDSQTFKKYFQVRSKEYFALVDLAVVVLVLAHLALVVLAALDKTGNQHQGNITLEIKEKVDNYI